MNMFLAVGAMVAFSFVEVTNPSSTTWLDDYGTALQVARLTQRPLLLVLENPHEKDQRLGVADDERLADLFSRFELCRVDVTTDYGKQVAKSYGATTFPYTAITDERCRSVVFRGAGKASPEIWKRTLSAYSNTETNESKNNNDGDFHSHENDYGRPRLFSHENLESATVAAEASGRPILVFVTMPGCYHCVRMKSETYQDPSIQLQIAEEFESVVVDQTDEPDWVHEKGVTLFPTTLVLNQNGEVTIRLPGYVSAQELAIRLNSMSQRSLSQL